ncbi:LacI family DNA-binding transcriptional regulator [Halanaerocella petrolearia]
MSKEITIKDVANLANCSPTTVSRVINNSDHPVSDETRAKVEEAIEKLNFEPNRIAQGLKSNKSRIIGVIVHDICDAYFAQMVKGIEEVIFDYDYIINIYNTSRDVDKELHAVNMLKANRADAIVFAGGNLIDSKYKEQMEGYIQDLKNQGSVIVGVTSHPFNIKNIELGNQLATQTITDYVLNKGHKKIAYIDGPKILSTTRERLKGYKSALVSRNIKPNKEFILEGDFTFEGGRKAALKLLNIRKDNNITAAVASNDETALGLMWELKNQGIEIPEEISVVGIDNIPDAKYSYPPLTTISLPIYRLGVQIGNYIIDSLQNNENIIFGNEIDVQVNLIERLSVKDLD